jgi:hypothetical protein
MFGISLALNLMLSFNTITLPSNFQTKIEYSLRIYVMLQAQVNKTSLVSLS